MLAIQQQSRIVPKLVKMADGRMALVQFLVTFEAGTIKAKAISICIQDESVISKEETLALCGACEKAGEIISRENIYSSVVSPYSGLLFFVSQPTRAPSL